MLIHEMIDYCNYEYNNSNTQCQCHDCNHPSECSGSCKKCLEQVHYPNMYPNGKHYYDCQNMINFYVCDYINKYASEMLYLLRKSEKLREIDEYHVLSIGCGAAPDLMAFEQYCLEADRAKDIRYYGVDINPLWKRIHQQIKKYDSELINHTEFDYVDAMKYFKSTPLIDTNVMVLQYVISHFYNTGQIDKIKSFFTNLIKNVIETRKEHNPFVILINDVNSCNRGRNYFEDLVEILKKQNYYGHCSLYYFDYNIKHDGQRYGKMHPQNNTLFDLDYIDLKMYEPWKYCSSAQMLIELE